LAKAATQTRYNRIITVDFHDETTYSHLLNDGKAFLECVLAFILHGSLSQHPTVCGLRTGMVAHASWDGRFSQDGLVGPLVGNVFMLSISGPQAESSAKG
jgi:hypothetical protein